MNGTCDIVTNCNVDPEEAQTVEIGGKIDLNGQLSLNAAVFRNERSNFRVPSGDPTIPEQQLDGNSRVDGIALGAAGAIGTKWSIFANYTYLDSEVVQSVSDRLLLGGTIDILAGDPLPNTPEHSASVWTTYQISQAFSVGYGVTYQGEYTFARTERDGGSVLHAGLPGAPRHGDLRHQRQPRAAAQHRQRDRRGLLRAHSQQCGERLGDTGPGALGRARA